MMMGGRGGMMGGMQMGCGHGGMIGGMQMGSRGGMMGGGGGHCAGGRGMMMGQQGMQGHQGMMMGRGMPAQLQQMQQYFNQQMQGAGARQGGFQQNGADNQFPGRGNGRGR